MVAAVAEPGAVAAGGRPLLVVHRAVGFWYLGDGGPELGGGILRPKPPQLDFVTKPMPSNPATGRSLWF